MHSLRLLRLAGAAALLAALALAPAPLAAAEPLAGDGPWMVRAWFGDEAMIREVASWGDHFQHVREKGFLRLVVDGEQLAKLRGLGFFVEEDAEATALIRLAETAQDGWDDPETIPGFPCYRTVEETYADAQTLAAAHPTLAIVTDVGDSWDKLNPPNPPNGWDLLVLKLTNSEVPGPKPVLMVTAAIHAREYTTAESALRFAEWIVGAHGLDADATWVLDHHEIHIVLHANPDGRKVAEGGSSWRKNRNNTLCAGGDFGIDLNRNFDFYWGQWGGSSGDPCSQTYRGAAAGSEPETQVVASYMEAVFTDWRPIDDLVTPVPEEASGLFVDLHSFGGAVLMAWGQTPDPGICNGAPPLWPPNCDQLLRLGRKWAYLSGYDPEVGSLYLVDGSTKDYSYGRLGIPGYTWEMGSQFFESCSAFESAVLPDALAMLRYAMRVPRAPYLLPAGPDALNVAGPPLPIAPGDPAPVSATIDDTRYLDPGYTEPSQPIAAAELYVGTPEWAGGTPVAMGAVDGAFDETVEPVAVTLDTTGMASGRYLLFVRGRDGANDWGATSATYLTVIDPATAPFLEGTVIEQGSGTPLAATVAVGPYSASTDSGTGAYSVQIPEGTYDVTASAPGHAPATVFGVTLATGQTVVQDFELVAFAPVFADDVEGGNPGWTPQNQWAITTLQAHSPTHSWTDSPSGNYGNNWNSSLTSPAIDLSAAIGVEVSFWHRYVTESGWDFCHVEVSADNGTSWTEIALYDGSNPTWNQQTFLVPQLAGAAQARVRFRITTDTNTVFDGWYVDDVVVSAAIPQGAPQALAVTVVGEGTVTSTPPGIACPPDCGHDYPAGTPVTLTAAPAADWSFTGWSGDCTGAGSCNLTMSQARSVTATFVFVDPMPFTDGFETGDTSRWSAAFP